jgi:hypothetical protein
LIERKLGRKNQFFSFYTHFWGSLKFFAKNFKQSLETGENEKN